MDAMTTFTPRSGLLAEALFGASHNLSLTEAVNAADRVLADPVQEAVVEAFARLVDSLAEAAKTRDPSSLAEKTESVAASVALIADHERPEARAFVVHDFAALKRQAELA